MYFPIKNLPDDVLIEIFSLLDVQSLKEATSVCQHWNNLVSSNAVTMRKFELQLIYDGRNQVQVESRCTSAGRFTRLARLFRRLKGRGSGIPSMTHGNKIEEIMNSKRRHIAILISCSVPVSLIFSENDNFLRIIQKLGGHNQS